MNKRFDFHADPGHGWLEVSLADITDVGLTPAAFSGFSYNDNTGLIFFLEEDADATLFDHAYANKYGQRTECNVHHYNVDAPVRDLPRLPMKGH